MLSWLRRLFDGQYVALLEEEVQRLRGENRALMNSLLGTAGFPPLEFPGSPVPRELPRTRRRSWHQIQTMKESEFQREANAVKRSASV